MLTVALLIATFILIALPIMAGRWLSFLGSLLLFSIFQFLTGWSFFQEIQDPDFDDGASVIIAAGIISLPTVLLLALLILRCASLLVRTLIKRTKGKKSV